MKDNVRRWRVVVGGLAVGVAGVLALSGAQAAAEPVLPVPPSPAPAPSALPQAVATTPGMVGGGRSVGIPSPAPAPVSYPAGSAIAPATPAPSAPPLPAGAAGASAQAAPPQPAQPARVPATSGTLRDYLKGHDVELQPQKPAGFTAFDITLPLPPGWTQVPDPNVIDAFVVTANRNGNSIYTSNAQLVVYRLVGEFDPNEAITHGLIDSQQLPAWQTTKSSLADFGGFPSSLIEGTYLQNNMTLNTSRRHVIATSGPDRYLVSLAVTTDAAQAVADAPATDVIVRGFRVTTPAVSTAPVPARPGPPPAPAPAPSPRG